MYVRNSYVEPCIRLLVLVERSIFKSNLELVYNT